MPITFLEAKARVSPDKPVIPGSQEHLDILELMKQSGHMFADQNVVVPDPTPPKATHISHIRRFSPRPPMEVSKSLSKKEWLSVKANRDAYEANLALNHQVPVGAFEPSPLHLLWDQKVAPKYVPGMSKREWVALLLK